MKYLIFILTLINIFGACTIIPKVFDGSTCEKFDYGRVETRRTLTPEDKKSLEKKGVIIKELLFENQYLGVWKRKWNEKNTEKLPVKSFTIFNVEDKIASGGTIADIEKLSSEPGESIVLIQTIGPVSNKTVEEFGDIQVVRDSFYRMKVAHKDLMSLLYFPCLRTFSILKETYEHD